MHMSDALISPEVGLSMLAIAGGALALSCRSCSREIRSGENLSQIPLMGVLGAFVFAAQMINFTIPGTGSSGHIAGALLLAVLLGPAAGFIVIASVLLVQALLFADGGLLAYGANLFNMGFIPCFLVYPFLWRPLISPNSSRQRIVTVSLVTGIIAMTAGAFTITVQTVLSGITTLPFFKFLMVIVPIHILIGVGEGLITASVVLFTFSSEGAELFLGPKSKRTGSRRTVVAFAIAAAVLAGMLSWFASSNPDGLEWSVARVESTEEAGQQPAADLLHQKSAELQQSTSLLPDYQLGTPKSTDSTAAGSAISWRTSAAGLIGSALTLTLVLLLAMVLKMRQKRSAVPLARG
ncbi:MAG: energy-coupling factor ABC transporter permease [Desulforhopalus sp.]|nr:energy-coupling factor ABC transporter permease [Desulforhopalus sp.]